MSARSGVFTKYVVEFVDSKFTVSNDISKISAGNCLVDADITVTMARDTAGTIFTIILYNLPQDKAEALDNALMTRKTYQSLKISLGYFETDTSLVVEGIYEKVETKVTADASSGQNRLVTTITGKEKALRACTDAKYVCSLSDDDALTATKAAQKVLSEVSSDANKKLHPGIDSLVKGVKVVGTLKGKADTTFNNNSVLTVLSEIAQKAKAELLIVDGNVILGAPIKYDPDPPGASGITLDPSVNLAQIARVKIATKSKTAGTKTPRTDESDTDVTIRTFNFTALGDPTMRPGQKVTVSGVKGYSSTTEFRINTVTHQFNVTGTSAGYVCNGEAADAANATASRDAPKQSATGGAQDVASAIKSEAGKNPVIEVTLVKSASDQGKYPYQADLYYGQTRDDEQQPSIEVGIATRNDCHTYRHRPIASPFAWRKCGLVTPVYRTMKALVAHNLGLATDGVVTGYMWSGKPDFPPPPSKPGDWWLSLPIDVDATSLPPDKPTPDQPSPDQDPTAKKIDEWATFNWATFDQTKAVNDLTGATGKRVIEVKGLKITVGAGKLAAVGTRPSEGPDDDFLIEHSSGTSVHIDANGALTIDASKASLTIKGDVVIQGSLEIK